MTDNKDKKIAFFDIDGTLTSELDGSVPDSARDAIRLARAKGHKMFLNTGRCFQNVEPKFREVGFDGYVCGCGTNIHVDGAEVLYVKQSPEVIASIRKVAGEAGVDILFECRDFVAFDRTRPLTREAARIQLQHFLDRGYDMDRDVYTEDFCCDKYVIWYEKEDQLSKVRAVSDEWFECIDRHAGFREFVPKNYSKATGIQYLLDYYGIPLENAYAFGDSNNDLAMLTYVPNSVAMGNSIPEDLKKKVAYVTDKASEDGIAKALKNLGFLD